MLIDSHCHLDDSRYNGERAQIIQNARNAGVKQMITIGCDVENSLRARGIALTHADVHFTAGVHPHESAKASSNFIDELRKIATHIKCVGIGECGLDFFYDHSPRETQIQIFTQQILLAKELKKALVIHVRDAFDVCIDALKEHLTIGFPIIIHCFTGTYNDAKRLLDLGCTISISGIVTFAKAAELVEAVQKIPLDRLLIETDAPYLAPIPHRGKRNEPAMVALVAKEIAKLKGISEHEVGVQVHENLKKIFAI